MTLFKPACRAASLVAAGLVLPANVAAQQAGDRVPGSYICVFKDGEPGASDNAVQAARQAGGTVRHTFTNALQGFALSIPDVAVQRLVKGNPNIAYCDQDRIASLPDSGTGIAKGPPGGGGGGGGGGSGGGGKPAPAQTVPWGVDRVGGAGNGVGKTAWVIDTGVDLDHPDLTVDVGRSVSFIANDSSPDDFNGHGTHVAGTIAALNNSFGSVGVAAGANVVSLRVLDRRGNGLDSDVIAAIDYAAGHASPGDVVNLSLITDYMQSMNDAVAGAGAVGIYVVSAAGNNSANVSSYSPASATGPNVFTVSAIADGGGTWAFYSNFGAEVDVAEPGSSIYSLDKNGGYTTKSGTSMAAPHLSGILLANGGTVSLGGYAVGDPDGIPDPIGVR